MIIENMKFTDEMLKGKNGRFILVGLQPAFKKEEERKVRIGTEVTVAMTAFALEKFKVIVEEQVPCSAFPAEDLREVSFQNFEATFTKCGDLYMLEGQASKFQLV